MLSLWLSTRLHICNLPIWTTTFNYPTSFSACSLITYSSLSRQSFSFEKDDVFKLRHFENQSSFFLCVRFSSDLNYICYLKYCYIWNILFTVLLFKFISGLNNKDAAHTSVETSTHLETSSPFNRALVFWGQNTTSLHENMFSEMLLAEKDKPV